MAVELFVDGLEPKNPDAVFWRALIMISKLCHEERFVSNFKNDSMLIIYSPGPITGKAMFEGFRFSDSLERRALDIFDKLIYPV